jgi:hypothetical protein
VKKFKTVLLVLLGSSLMGASCLPQAATDTQPKPSPQAEAEVAESDEATKDWQVYDHQGPDYQLKYPQGWFARLTPNPTMGDLEFLNISTTSEEFTPTNCSFGVKTWDREINDEEIAKQRVEGEMEEVMIGGVKARKYVYSPNNEYTAQAHFFQKDGYWYSIEFSLKKDQPQEACLELLNQILKTFKFT